MPDDSLAPRTSHNSHVSPVHEPSTAYSHAAFTLAPLASFMAFLSSLLFFGPALAYPFLQVLALVRTTGGVRVAAALPLLLMVPVLVWTAVAYSREANLWPLTLIFASPVAVLYLIVVLAVGRRNNARIPA